MKKGKFLTALLACSMSVVAATACSFAVGCKKDKGNGGEGGEPSHTHQWATTWSKDDSKHWKDCTNPGCDGTKNESASHVWENDQDTTCDVCGQTRTVTPGPAPTTTSISLNKETLTLGIGNTEAELEATISNGEANAEVVWTSDNESVVLVGDTGAVEALKPGSATITATIKDTEIKATCDVLVEDAYYIIGGADSQWNKCAAFGVESVIYFMPTQTEGIYKTKSFELKNGADFQVAKVGITLDDGSSNAWWNFAYNGNYIAADDAVLSKNQGNNIAVSQHAWFTITLDLTGDTAVVSGVMDGDPIDDSNEPIVYYLRGDMNGWAEATDPENPGNHAFTDNGDKTYTLSSVALTKGQGFKVAVAGNGWIGAINPGKVHGAKIAGGASDASKKVPLYASGEDIKVGVSGTYDFTITADGILDYTFTETATTEADAAEGPEALYYFIKGPANGGWNSVTELQETEAGSGIYTATLTLAAGDFMFFSTTNSTGSGQYYYFNATNMKLDAEDDCVTEGSANYIATAGEYVIKLNLATRTVEIEKA